MEDVLVLLLLKQRTTFIDVLKDLEKRGYVVYFQGNYYVTPTSDKLLKDILLRSENIKQSDDLDALSKELISLFPDGLKDGTRQAWRCSVKECSMRLREFYKMFGKYSREQILSATKDYVNSFVTDRTLMRTLKYFIWKQEKEPGAKTPMFTSDLATWIESPQKSTPLFPAYSNVATR
jgi:hypothetical protein